MSETLTTNPDTTSELQREIDELESRLAELKDKKAEVEQEDVDTRTDQEKAWGLGDNPAVAEEGELTLEEYLKSRPAEVVKVDYGSGYRQGSRFASEASFNEQNPTNETKLDMAERPLEAAAQYDNEQFERMAAGDEKTHETMSLTELAQRYGAGEAINDKTAANDALEAIDERIEMLSAKYGWDEAKKDEHYRRLLELAETAKIDREAADAKPGWYSRAKSALDSKLTAFYLKLGSFGNKGELDENESAEDREKYIKRQGRKRALGILAVAVVSTGITAYKIAKGMDTGGSGGAPVSPQGGGLTTAHIDTIKQSVPVATGDLSGGFSGDALRVDSGEGWFNTFKEMKVPQNEWPSLLEKVGPDLQAKGWAYQLPNGEWGMNKSGQLPEGVLQLIQNSRNK